MIYGFGGPEKIELVEMPRPVLAPDGVLIAVVAAGINPVDCKIRRGRQISRFPHHFPLILGWDVAGVVEQVGDAVTRFGPGDRVVAYARKSCIEWGTYAELVTVAEESVATAPASLDLVHGAALPLAGLTAYQVMKALDVQSGQRVLVHGGSGGVGHYLIQLLVPRGVQVLATSSPSGHDFIRSLGGEAIDRLGDVEQQVRRLAPAGVEAVADLAGPDAVNRSLGVVADGATVVSILLPPLLGAEEKSRGIKARYIFVRSYGDQLAQLVAMVDAGVLSIHLDRTFPLDQAAGAHRALEAGGIRGKIALTIA